MSHSHLTSRERFAIEQLLFFGLSYREIGRRLDRHHSTIGREVSRNSSRHKGASYNSDCGDRLALERRCRRRHQRRRGHRTLWDYVCRGLRSGWSPEQICGRLRRDHSRSQKMRIAPETIYQWIFRDAAGGQAGHQPCARRFQRDQVGIFRFRPGQERLHHLLRGVGHRAQPVLLRSVIEARACRRVVDNVKHEQWRVFKPGLAGGPEQGVF